MPRTSRSGQISEEEKKKRRREQKKLSIRRARAKMDEAALEERRRKDRERYKRKKELGQIKTVKDYTPREQRQIRKIWREKAKKKRDKEKMKKREHNFVQENTPPSSPSFSRIHAGRVVATRNRRRLVAENNYLKRRVLELESKMAKYRMRCTRASSKLEKKKECATRTIKTTKTQEIRKVIHDFLLQDEHSRLTSGKKDTITRRKIKKQIRFLNDSLLNLHKAFVNKIGITISYETFRRNRPFWVLFPKVDARNTCLCAIHTNNDYIIRALYHSKIIPYGSATSLMKYLCCNNALAVICLERNCPDCKDKTIQCNDFVDNDTISYERWVTKTVTVVIKGEAKQCKKTIKEKVQTTKKALVDILISNLPTFMKHVAYVVHQFKTIQNIKSQLTPKDGLLHIDFSENYQCKYGQEIQSAHFGGSKIQLSLHTSVYYSTQLEPPHNYSESTSFCTVSENVRHDPVLICVHLQALVNRVKELSPDLKNLHILSDGPSTQYRNKSMFHLIASYLSKEFRVDSITWHYSERGHGKGAPDGVGGCIKRTCDNHVARGHDVASLDEMMLCLGNNCKGIEVYRINESLVPEIQQLIDNSITRPFKGTFGIHQLTWSVKDPGLIHARRLSCLMCAPHQICPHYEMGRIQINHIRDSIGTSRTIATPDSSLYNLSPDCPERSGSPDSSSEYLPVRDSPVSPATPEAPTEPNSPGLSDRLTPDLSIEIFNQRPQKPQKFQNKRIYSDDSEASEDSPQKKRPTNFMWDDSDEDNIF